jgi:hypothetical protein
LRVKRQAGERLGDGGIHLHNLRYDSEELAAYRKECLNNDNPKLIVKTDSEDISFVHVYLPKRSYVKNYPTLKYRHSLAGGNILIF